MLQELCNPAQSRWPTATDTFWGAPAHYEEHFRQTTYLSAASSSGLAEFGQGAQLHVSQHLPHSSHGCLAAFSLVFLGEFGDKTFFTAALLAMRLGRGISFAGSVLALAAMSLIGVGIGTLFASAPDNWAAGLPVGELLGVSLLVLFGINSLRKAASDTSASHPRTSSSDSSSSSSSHDGSSDSCSDTDSELAEAEEAVAAAASSGRLGQHKTALASVLEVAALMFLAEWGDRSMLATVALGAAQSPVGVAVGATAAYCAATGLAVVGGALAAKHVKEQTVDVISGVLFLIFAAGSVVAML